MRVSEEVLALSGEVSRYEDGVKHDKFGTLKHQLAAAAFNAMMEFYFSRYEQGE
jgi:hypothetical protein